MPIRCRFRVPAVLLVDNPDMTQMPGMESMSGMGH